MQHLWRKIKKASRKDCINPMPRLNQHKARLRQNFYSRRSRLSFPGEQTNTHIYKEMQIETQTNKAGKCPAMHDKWNTNENTKNTFIFKSESRDRYIHTLQLFRFWLKTRIAQQKLFRSKQMKALCFAQSPKSFSTFWKVSRQTKRFPDGLKSSGESEKFPESLKCFRTV